MLLGVDVGGTFTDAVLLGDGVLVTAKAPTTPEDQSLGVMAAVEAALARADREAREVTAFAHGMTVATNALLEGRACAHRARRDRGLHRRRGAGPAGARRPLPPVRDAPRAARAAGAALRRARADDARRAAARADAGRRRGARARPSPPPSRRRSRSCCCTPIATRSTSSGSATRSPPPCRARTCRSRTRSSARFASTSGPRRRRSTPPSPPCSAATCAGSPRGRGRRGCPSRRSCSRTAASSTSPSAAAHAAWTVLSGPAGGAAGAAFAARAAGVERALCLDMGGTSADVCVVHDGAVAETGASEIAGRPIALPTLDVHTVGAGGGSIAWRDAGGALRVGPRSAGAVPGPACYGRGGEEPTVTDANLLLGHLPHDVPLAGGVALDRAAAERAVGGLARELGARPARLRRGDRARRERGDDARAARRDGRARDRPARPRARRVRRRRAAARGRDRGGAGDRARDRAARVRRARGARPRRRPAPARRAAQRAALGRGR